MGKGGKTSMCHHANAHCTHPYVALNNLHVAAGDGRGYCGEGAESKPEPIIPLCLLRLQTDQIPHEAHPAAVALICQSSSSPSLGGGELWYAFQQPSPPLPSSLWSIWSHLLRADLFDRCISESYWVTISTPRHSHFDD